MVLRSSDRGAHAQGGPRSFSGRSPVTETSPTLDDLVRDLRLLRARGLLRVRRLSLPALTAAARAAGLDTQNKAAPQPIETLLRIAVRPLGESSLAAPASLLPAAQHDAR